MEDPERYLTELGVEVPSLFDTTRKAVLDAAHRVRVNHDVFFFADDEERERFLKNPVTLAPFLTDPVNGHPFRPRDDSPRREAEGRLYVFETEASRALFDADPDSFSVPRLAMATMAP